MCSLPLRHRCENWYGFKLLVLSLSKNSKPWVQLFQSRRGQLSNTSTVDTIPMRIFNSYNWQCRGTQKANCGRMHFVTQMNENIWYWNIYRCSWVLLRKIYQFLFHGQRMISDFFSQPTIRTNNKAWKWHWKTSKPALFNKSQALVEKFLHCRFRGQWKNSIFFQRQL